MTGQRVESGRRGTAGARPPWSRRRVRVTATAPVLAALALAVVAAGCASPLVGVPAPAAPAEPSWSAPSAQVVAPGVPDASCEPPASGAELQRVAPADVALDPVAVQEAVDYAAARGAQSVRVYRHGCLVATSANDAATGWSQMPVWSMTKGVVALLAGRAVQLGRLGLDDPIGTHVDGLDAAHGAITVRHLLTQTSGLRFAWANDLNAAATGDSARLVLQRPFEAAPGTRFIYAQTTVTALVAVIEAAVGEDLQSFAQRELFGPVGIARGEWAWQRDGVGRTQGFAFLDITPRAMGRLGSLLLAEGEWGGVPLLPADFIAQGAAGTDANPGYGFLWRTNAGERHRDSGYVDSDWLERRWVPAAPVDMFGLSGMFNQNVFVLPGLDMVVVRMGLPAGMFGDPVAEWEGERPAWEHHFFRTLLTGVQDVPVPDPGDWRPDPDRQIVDLDHIIGLGF